MPPVVADPADITLFLAVAHAAQNAARALADLQSNPTVHGLTPHESSTLAALIRGTGTDKMGLNPKERDALIGLLDAAGKSAVMIPAETREARDDRKRVGLSISSLVTTLLNSGNLLEQAAIAAQTKEPST